MGTHSSRPALLPGTLEMLILKTLARHGSLHGSGIADAIFSTSGDVLQVEEGSLYPALHRMEQDGWVKAEWGTTEKNRQARLYSLTAAGRRQLEQEQESWSRLTLGVGRVLRFA